VYGEDPTAVARRWANEGAQWLHVVDLDAALEQERAVNSLSPGGEGRGEGGKVAADQGFTPPSPPLKGGETYSLSRRCAYRGEGRGERGRALPLNQRRLVEIRAAVPEASIQFGGGLRTLEAIEAALALGADRVVLGTAAVYQPELVARALARFGPERIVAGIDARRGLVATHGWQQTSQVTAAELGRAMRRLGVLRAVYTDVSRDGMLAGANVEATAALARATGLGVIASGGVASLDDVIRLRARAGDGIEGVIVGQALYRGTLSLPGALQVAR